MIEKTEAIVLRSIDYRDESKILSLYTREFGRLSAIAKGCRSSTSRYGSALEPASHIETVLYKKSSRDVQNLSSANLLTPMPSLSRGTPDVLSRLAAILPAMELLRLSTEDGDKNVKLFDLTVSLLRRIDASKKNFLNFFFYFEVRLIGLLGFKPSFRECVLSGKRITDELEAAQESGAVQPLLLIADKGGVALGREASARGAAGRRISAQAYRIIEHLSEAKLDEVENLFLQQTVVGEVSEILDVYLRFHIDDLPPLRSREIFNQMTV